MKESANGWVLLGIFAGFLYLVSPVLPPFVVGAFFAWLLDPLVKKLVHWKLPRLVAVLFVFLVFISAVVLGLLVVIPRMGAEAARLVHMLPEFIHFVQQQIPDSLLNVIPMDFASLKNTLTENGVSGLKAGGFIGVAVQAAFHSGAKLATWLANLILVPVVAVYLLYDWDQVLFSVQKILPLKYKPTLLALAAQCDAVLAAFFRGQLLVMLTLGIVYSVGLTVMGLQLGLLIGVMIGVMAIIPYLGVTMGVTFACIAAWVQFGSWHALLPVLLFFTVVQALDGMLITPRLVGQRIGLHPVLVIFAVLSGGAIGGFAGVLVALPLAAMMRVLFDFFTLRRAVSE